MGAWKDMMIQQDYAAQQAAEDWYRFQMERDDALQRRRELLIHARQLQTAGQRLARFFPEVGRVNLILASQYRQEARQIREDYR